MRSEEFLKFCKEKDYPINVLTEFKKALKIAEKYLAKKKRLAGDNFFERNIRVATILVENKADPSTIIVGLLHKTLEEKAEEDIRKVFSEEILRLLEGIAKVKAIRSKNKQLEAEALRKVILATIQDFRILLVLLAVKLDNLRSVNVFSEKEQREIAKEVLDFYAPLAYRLGMEKIRFQLEDLSFEIANPRRYQEIKNFLKESEEIRVKNIKEVVDLIKKSAREINILKIKGRPKHIYSIYRKIVQRGVPLNEQFDLLGVRIVVEEEKDCYALLGRLHENFKTMEGRLKDYIANPKENFYRSIHTAVQLPNQKIVEIQIRTPEMDEYAEEGVAAHWRYKGGKAEDIFEKKVSWLKGVLELQKESSAQEFLEAAKVDLFGDKIHCYTPKGDVKELPKESTLLDFAFSVHEEVGNKAIGGKVNGKFVPLKHPLEAGDVVEILTSKNQRPRRSWLKIVKSGKTRQKIRKSLKEHEKLPPLFYRVLKPDVREEQGILLESPAFPKAICVLAKCCLPLPGEEVVGIVTKRRMISVHDPECKQANKIEDRWVEVNWKERFNQKIGFYVIAAERSGLLADVLHTIAQAGFVVKEAKAKIVNNDMVECSFLIIPRDLEELKLLIQRVLKVKGVSKIYFE